MSCPPHGSILTILPEADVYVRDGSYASTNYGTADSLVTKQDAAGYARQSYLRFNLASISGTIASAKVTLIPVGVSMSGTTNQAQLVTDNSWAETTVNWNNKPAGGTAFATWALTTAYTPAQFDVTDQVNGALAADKKMSLLIASTSNQGAKGDVSYASREHANASYRPVLEVTLSTPPASLSTELTGWQHGSNGRNIQGHIRIEKPEISSICTRCHAELRRECDGIRVCEIGDGWRLHSGAD